MWRNVFERCMQCAPDSRHDAAVPILFIGGSINYSTDAQTESIHDNHSALNWKIVWSYVWLQQKLRTDDLKRAKFYSTKWKSQWTVNSFNSMESNIRPSGKSARKIFDYVLHVYGCCMDVNSQQPSSLASSITGTQRHCRQHHYSIWHE